MKKFKKIIFLACFVMLIAVMAIAISAAATESIDLDTSNLTDKSGKVISIDSVVDKDGNTVLPKEEGGKVYTLPLYDGGGNALSYYFENSVLKATLSSNHFKKNTDQITNSKDFIIVNLCDSNFDNTTATPKLENKTNLSKLLYVWLNETTTTISAYSFKNTNLIEITVPSSVTSIGEGAFQGCSSLTAINFAENSNLTTIGNSAISGCTKLTAIDLSKLTALEKIDSIAFKGDTSLAGEIVIPSTVTTIGSSVFQNCTAITAINIPSSVISMGDYAFSGCTALATLDIAENGNITSIGNSVFANCSALTTFDFSKFTALETIGEHAFYGSPLTGEFVIPSTVTTIGNYAFNNCKKITKITFPSALKSIGDYAFQWTDKLIEADFSQCTENITIGKTAFTNLTTLNLGPTTVTLDSTSGSFPCSNLSTVIMSYSTFDAIGAYGFNSGKNTTFYIVGGPKGITDRATETEISTLRDNAIAKGNNGKLSEASTFIEYDGNTTYSNKTIVYNYNLCVAFHGGNHDKSAAVLAYANGFDNAGTSTCTCTRKCGYTYEPTTIDPIFAASGYSIKGTNDAIYGGFTVDTAALAKYNAYVGEGKELKYGIVIVNVGDASNISFTNGVIDSTKAIQVEIKDTTFTRFGFTLTGFNDENGSKALNIVISAYVIDENGEMSFVQKTEDYSKTVTVNSVVSSTLGAVTFADVDKWTTKASSVA